MSQEAKSIFEDLLVSDFEQCFEQMRHYDDAFQNILQFAYAGVVAVAGASGTLLQIHGSERLNLTTVSFMLVLSWLAGIMVVMFLAKNRVYFAMVARHVNEIRKLYIEKRPAGIANKAKMFTDYKFPPVLDLGSTQTFQICIASAFDSFLFASAAVALIALRDVTNGSAPKVSWSWCVLGFLTFLTVQLLLIARYWRKKESELKPTPDAARKFA